jgi:hypothetical protein
MAVTSPNGSPAEKQKHLGTGIIPEDPMATRIQDGVEYKSVKWWQAGMAMVAETISLPRDPVTPSSNENFRLPPLPGHHGIVFSLCHWLNSKCGTLISAM